MKNYQSGEIEKSRKRKAKQKKSGNNLLCLVLCFFMVVDFLPVSSGAQELQESVLNDDISVAQEFAATEAITTVEEIIEEELQGEEGNPQAELTKLATPTNLEWGYWRDCVSDYDPETNTTTYKTLEWPGVIGWKPVEPTQLKDRIRIYKEGISAPIYDNRLDGYGANVPEWRSFFFWWQEDLESGNYYFTVTSEGDNIHYLDSDTATSDIWNYVRPGVKLETCKNINWNWPYMNFTSTEANLGGYAIQIYFSATAEEEPYCIENSSVFGEYMEFMPEPQIPENLLQRYGKGYYSFSIRPLSRDITIACHGEWSEQSEAFFWGEESSGVKSELENIVNASGSMSDEEIRDAVQDMDTADLKTAMLADQNVVDDVAALENKVGGPAPVEVSGEASAFDQSKVSIVGANLNNAKSEEDPIKLVIDKPEKEHVLDTLYDSSVAVKFSMDLENVEDTRNLEVPVKITLPIPGTINPEFLVILHYHADGSVEELTLGNDVYVFTEGGQRYASFVLTSFSDFVLTQLVQATPSVPMHRMYDPNSGEHFYTGAELERDFLVEAGWHYEGVGFNFPEEGAPVHRLYEPVNGEHLYTMDQAEVDKLLGWGWQYEGVAFNSAGDDEVPQYRLHNPNAKRGGYHFTGSETERDLLISLGWIDQGIGWYSCKE